MQQCYVSVLCDDDFLPGLMALHQSLKNAGAKFDFVLMVTPEVSGDVRRYLDACGITTREIEPVESPYAGWVTPELGRMFTKMRAFALTEYRKVVYMDLDMLVCANLDDVFDRPGWSAVNAGGMLPEHADWRQFNAGFMVIEPDAALFADLVRLKDVLPSADGGDQGFLHNYFPDWSKLPHLHLDHSNNLYAGHLNRYHELFGYHLPVAGKPADARTVRVVHFWGPFKPWDFGRVDYQPGLHNDAFRLWWENFEQALGNYPEACKDAYLYQRVLGVTRCRGKVLADQISEQYELTA
jgi:alpha-N-acetylglucosamine transferase